MALQVELVEKCETIDVYIDCKGKERKVWLPGSLLRRSKAQESSTSKHDKQMYISNDARQAQGKGEVGDI